MVLLASVALFFTVTGCAAHHEPQHQHQGYGGSYYEGPAYPQGYGQGEYRGYPNYPDYRH